MKFVYAPALYPSSPLEGEDVFLHGECVETKTRNGELVVRARDEKGEWEAYGEHAVGVTKGTPLRAYGTIAAQPDGRMMLAAKWIKPVEQDEMEYCKKKTHQEWTHLIEAKPELSTLAPFVPPKPVTKTLQVETTPPKNAQNDTDFVSASEIKIEREYL